MGQCVMGKSKVRPTGSQKEKVEDLKIIREKLVQSIHSIHRIYLDCSTGIDQCRIDDKKNVALVLRMKYLYLRDQEKLFQEVIKKVDEEIESGKVYPHKKIAKETARVLSVCNEVAGRNDVNEILQDNSEYVSLIKAELQNLNYDYREIEEYINQVFCDRPNSDNRVVRKRYNRRSTG